MKKGRIFILGLIIIAITINILAWLFLLPYSQLSADCHYFEGDYIGIVYTIVAVVLSVVGLRRYRKNRNLALLIAYIILVCSLFVWGCVLCSLECTQCANGA